MSGPGNRNYNTSLSPQTILDTPFTIDDWDGNGATLGRDYMVNSGVIFSKYSFDTGSFVPVLNFNSQLIYKENAKIYLEFIINSNLQVSGAIFKCEPIGKDAPDGGWTNYPELYKIEPGDEYDDQGRIKIMRDGKRQTRAYALVGYTENDIYKNTSQAETSSSSSSSSNSNNSSSSSSSSSSLSPPSWIQLLDTNLIMVATVASGVPCVVPYPYFSAGLKHYFACIDPSLV